ncbi:unnamed protein product [marine sediment metagenome]|uniref:Glycosyl hydrolases family 38 C-terminal domain-containing protein n=1 Tax=marine sediment metagenome TaxID=412755 RepID=X1HDR3_9ZZZZ
MSSFINLFLPVGLKSDRKSREDKKVECPIESEIKLFSEVQRVEFEDKLVFRIYNPTDREITGKIKLGFDIHKVYSGKLDESYREELPYNNGVEIELKPKEIKTIIFEVL